MVKPYLPDESKGKKRRIVTTGGPTPPTSTRTGKVKKLMAGVDIGGGPAAIQRNPLVKMSRLAGTAIKRRR